MSGRRHLEGKVALVSGGGTGIGAAVAERFRTEGAEVVVFGRREAPLQEVAKRTGAHVFAGDAGVAADAAAAVAFARERFGALDVLVPNAGGHGLGAATETGDDDWQLALHSNLTTAFTLCREAMPALVETRGTIVVISSLAGLFAGPNVAGYTTTKHALIGLTRSLARDYGVYGVRANAICPGWVATPMADEQMDHLGELHGVDRQGAYALATRDVPLQRPATPDDIASIAYFLATPESAIVTGAVIVADGGAHVVDLPTLGFVRDPVVAVPQNGGSA